MRFFLFLLSLWTVSAFAQGDASWEVNHYEHTRTFAEEGYAYQCDVKYGYVTLYNQANRWTYADQIDNRTGEVYEANLDASSSIGEEAVQEIKDIIDSAFSADEAQRLSEPTDSFVLLLFINPATGRVDEVAYNFFVFDACAQVPVSYYRKMELEIKERVSITPTEEDKHLNFILVSGVYAPGSH